MARDILPDIIRHVLEAAGADLTISTAVEPTLRRLYGGERYYFGKNGAPEKKTQLVGNGFALGLTTRQIAEAFGIPPRTVRWYASRRLRRR